MLFVIEGLDGCGKSTQVKKLKEYITQKTGSVKYIHFPRYDAPIYGDLISSFLRGEFGDLEHVHPKLVALLFALDRKDALKEIMTALEKGEVVLLDRYVYSNVAYQCSKLDDSSKAAANEKEALKNWILNTEFGNFKLPKPDLNIFLDVPTSFVEGNLASNRIGTDRDYLKGCEDIHEESITFQEKVRATYMALCQEDEHFICVDCADKNGNIATAEEIFSKIKLLADKKLK